MKPRFCTVALILQFGATFALCQPYQGSHLNSPPVQPGALIQRLYSEVVARRPLGVPHGADRKILEPYLSTTLLHRIELARSCGEDWSRQAQVPIENADRKEKASEKSPLAWAKLGFFSGVDELSQPSTFQIQKTELKSNGSFLFYLRLTRGDSQENQLSWDVTVLEVRENEHPVVEDVIYRRGPHVETEYRLSETLSEGCSGSHWIGVPPFDHPEPLVRSLYTKVVTENPLGVPEGPDKKAYSPYLSKALLHTFDEFLACDGETPKWKADHTLTVPFGSWEDGIFSGPDEQAHPQAFLIERMEAGKEHSSRVFVKLTRAQSGHPLSWHIAVDLVRESGHLVVDNIVHMNFPNRQDPGVTHPRLSELLSLACDNHGRVQLGDYKDSAQE